MLLHRDRHSGGIQRLPGGFSRPVCLHNGAGGAARLINGQEHLDGHPQAGLVIRHPALHPASRVGIHHLVFRMQGNILRFFLRRHTHIERRFEGVHAYLAIRNRRPVIADCPYRLHLSVHRRFRHGAHRPAQRLWIQGMPGLPQGALGFALRGQPGGPCARPCVRAVSFHLRCFVRDVILVVVWHPFARCRRILDGRSVRKVIVRLQPRISQ